MKLVVDRRAEVLAAIYSATMRVPAERALAEAHGITLETMQSHYARAVVVGLEHEGDIIGGMIFCGMFFQEGQVHIGILKPMRGLWAPWLRPMLELGFAVYGPRLKALVHKANRMAINFTRHVGGELVGERGPMLVFDIRKEGMIYERNR
jgi:hypothetical protein